jgi:hypothetical protein
MTMNAVKESRDRAIAHYDSLDLPLSIWHLYDVEWSDYGDERETIAIVDAVDEKHAILLLHRLGFAVWCASRYLKPIMR